jgi:aspartyl-tRNA(Asn)/glutamyl-tRNA(Gln) amidotransferase subunit A
MTVVSGCLARSVRDAARWYDVCAGFDARDPYSLPAEADWEAGLGSTDLRGLRAVISPDLGSAIISDAVRARVLEAGEALAASTGLDLVDVEVSLPSITWEWAIANQVGLVREVGDLWPDCEEQMTKSMAFGVRMGVERFDIEVAGRVEAGRTEANRRMAELFDSVDVVICASNPDVAFPAEIESNTRVAGEKAPPGNNGALTIPANISGNPAVSVPAGLVDGRPVGVQFIGRQHTDRMVLDLARAWELLEPWPLVAT